MCVGVCCGGGVVFTLQFGADWQMILMIDWYQASIKVGLKGTTKGSMLCGRWDSKEKGVMEPKCWAELFSKDTLKTIV